MCTCVYYLEIQQSHGKEGNACFANEGHSHFVLVAFASHHVPCTDIFIHSFYEFSVLQMCTPQDWYILWYWDQDLKNGGDNDRGIQCLD